VEKGFFGKPVYLTVHGHATASPWRVVVIMSHKGVVVAVPRRASTVAAGLRAAARRSVRFGDVQSVHVWSNVSCRGANTCCRCRPWAAGHLHAHDCTAWQCLVIGVTRPALPELKHIPALGRVLDGGAGDCVRDARGRGELSFAPPPCRCGPLNRSLRVCLYLVNLFCGSSRFCNARFCHAPTAAAAAAVAAALVDANSRGLCPVIRDCGTGEQYGRPGVLPRPCGSRLHCSCRKHRYKSVFRCSVAPRPVLLNRLRPSVCWTSSIVSLF
jgi:hypothetical protein